MARRLHPEQVGEQTNKLLERDRMGHPQMERKGAQVWAERRTGFKPAGGVALNRATSRG
jgi:hypothetical protein